MQTTNSPKTNKPIQAKAPGATLQKHIQHICCDTDTCRAQGVQWDTCLGGISGTHRNDKSKFIFHQSQDLMCSQPWGEICSVILGAWKELSVTSHLYCSYKKMFCHSKKYILLFSSICKRERKSFKTMNRYLDSPNPAPIKIGTLLWFSSKTVCLHLEIQPQWILFYYSLIILFCDTHVG